MNLGASSSFPERFSPILARDLALLLLLACLVRLVAYNGIFGSDDLVYFERTAQLARGDWSSSNYNGALRYGFNLPAAGFVALFGKSIFVANLWPLICSLIEIGAVFLFANAAMNRRAGIFAALLLASAPLHIGVATRIHADPVVSMFITVSFVLLYFGAISRRPFLLFAAGLTIGGIFWAKELVAVTWLAFLPLLWFFRGHWRSCFYVIGGVLLMMFLHGVLMFAIAGDPLHLVKVVAGAVKRNFVDGGDGEDSAAYYLKYLFFDLRHVGAIAFFAVASIMVFPRLVKKDSPLYSGYIFGLIWWIGLLLVLSIFPVSLSPLRFTMKQSNYITLFLAPTALLAGMLIASFPKGLGKIVLALCISFGLLLGVMQQASYLAFSANSKALAEFSMQHPRSVIVGSTNNARLSNFWANQTSPGSPVAMIVSFRELGEAKLVSDQQLRAADAIFAVLDQQTMNWVAGKSPITSALPCWEYQQTLEPAGLGLGNSLAKLASAMFAGIAPLANAMDLLSHPLRADVYRVKGLDVLCAK